MADASGTGSSHRKKKKRQSPGDNNFVEIRVAPSSSTPIVCSFPRGLPAALQQDGGTNGERGTRINMRMPNFSWRQLNTEKAGRSLVGSDESCLYTAQATEAEQESLESRLCVGVYDKHSGTLTLHQAAANGTVFALQQSVPSYECAETSRGNAPANLTGAEHRRALFEDFGSSKKRKTLRSQEANRVNIDTVVGAGSLMVDSFIKGESMSESNRQAVQVQQQQRVNEEGVSQRPPPSAAIENATNEWRKSFLPQYNENAKEPHLVYDARQIAGDLAWGHISRVVDACLRKDDVAASLMRAPPIASGTESNGGSPKKAFDDEWNESVKEIIRNEAAKMDPSAKQQLKCALLLNHFLNLFSKLSKKRLIPAPIEDNPRFFGAPLEIGHRFLELFTVIMAAGEENGFVMSKANKDKCCIHILILYVMAQSGKTMKSGNIKPVADDLKIDVKDATHLLREAGFKVQKIGSSKIETVLKTPVVFPDAKINRAKTR